MNREEITELREELKESGKEYYEVSMNLQRMMIRRSKKRIFLKSRRLRFMTVM